MTFSLGGTFQSIQKLHINFEERKKMARKIEFRECWEQNYISYLMNGRNLEDVVDSEHQPGYAG